MVEDMTPYIDRLNADCEREYQKLVRKIAGAATALEAIGERDMGVLTHSLAGVFHRITADLRRFSDTLAGNPSADVSVAPMPELTMLERAYLAWLVERQIDGMGPHTRQTFGGAESSVNRDDMNRMLAKLTTVPAPGAADSPPVPADSAMELVRDLVAWAQHMGGWESEVWRRAREFLDTDGGTKPNPYEVAARAAGFVQSDAEHGAIGRPADIDAGHFDATYDSWRECCEGEDIDVPARG